MAVQPREPGSNRSKVRGYNIAIEFIGSVFGMALLGWLADRALKSEPVGLLVGIGVGLVGGMVNLIRQGIALNKAMEAERRRKEPSSAQTTKQTQQSRDEWFHRETPQEDEDVRFPPGFDD